MYLRDGPPDVSHVLRSPIPSEKFVQKDSFRKFCTRTYVADVERKAQTGSGTHNKLVGLRVMNRHHKAKPRTHALTEVREKLFGRPFVFCQKLLGYLVRQAV